MMWRKNVKYKTWTWYMKTRLWQLSRCSVIVLRMDYLVSATSLGSHSLPGIIQLRSFGSRSCQPWLIIWNIQSGRQEAGLIKRQYSLVVVCSSLRLRRIFRAKCAFAVRWRAKSWIETPQNTRAISRFWYLSFYPWYRKEDQRTAY